MIDVAAFCAGAAVALLVTASMGIVRVIRGPTRADRLLVVQLLGTTGIAVLLLLARALDRPALGDVALAFALFAAVLAIAFVERGWD